MAAAVVNAVEMLGLSLAEAISLASTSPAHFLGLEAERGAIAPGLAADLVLLSDKGEVRATWIEGAELDMTGAQPPSP
jgi:N-acetylglucosamine-6-phosphate deacetylase